MREDGLKDSSDTLEFHDLASWDFTYFQVAAICCSILVLAYLMTELLDWAQLFTPKPAPQPVVRYGYTNQNGPHTWRKTCPSSSGDSQSPVNIISRQVVLVTPNDSLVWSGYGCQPSCMALGNDGHVVYLNANWPGVSNPHLSGGPLEFNYEFHNMCFHWGPSDSEGSEHTIDHMSFPMELQMLHLKRGFKRPEDVYSVGAKDGIVIVAYLFEISDVDNPYLDHIVHNLWRVQCPDTCVQIPPFPLDWIHAPFKKKYYTYSGSLTRPPCSEVVTWILLPDPIAISRQQVAQFRKLRSSDGALLANFRPVQIRNCRHIYYYDSC